MSIQTVVVKVSGIVLLSLGLVACGSMPSLDGVFIDQKEEYKKAHELPSLDIPPGLSGSGIKDEYDGGAKGTVSIARANAVVQTTPLADEQPTAELIKRGVDTHLLVRDSLRNTWRKTISVLETLGYDIEDKNRQSSKVYLNIAVSKGSSSMLSSLSFWEKSDTNVYIVSLSHIEDGVAIHVLDDDKDRVNNDISSDILSDLLDELAQ